MDNKLREQFFEQLNEEIVQLIDPKTGLIKTEYTKVIPCPLCDSKLGVHEKLFEKNGFIFVRCRSCSLIFTNPQINQDIVERLYEDSKSATLWSKLQNSPSEASWKLNYFKENLKNICNYLPEKHKYNLLDIGCSNGNFLEIVREEKPSWSLRGIDLSQEAVKIARGKNLSVDIVKFEDFKSYEPIDVITLFGVIEHLPNPKVLLTQVKDFAAKQGSPVTVSAVVPNAYSLYHMMLQQKSVSFDGRDHLVYYSEKTLHDLFEKVGFKKIKIDTVLDGLTAIKRQMQWVDPYNYNYDGDEFFPNENFKNFLNSDEFVEIMNKFNLGLRLRIIAEIG